MRTLITGGAGFLGSYLCEHFLSLGHQVICVDNLITGEAENVSHLLENRNFVYIEQDVTHYIHIDSELDNVLHFASPASPVDYLKHPIPTMKVGALGTLNALGLAKRKGARFLLASTSEVYGDPLIHPQREEYWGNVNPVGYRGVYDEAKRFAEALTVAYHRYHGLDTKIARIFNTYGPRMRLDDGRALPTFCKQALLGEDLTVFGDGSQTRSFCYVSDLVRGIEKLLFSDEHLPVNLGNPDEIPIIELARTIIELTGSRSGIRGLERPDTYEDDPKVRRPDIGKAIRILDWRPQVKLRDGLERTLEYFRAKLKIPSL